MGIECAVLACLSVVWGRVVCFACWVCYSDGLCTCIGFLNTCLIASFGWMFCMVI